MTSPVRTQPPGTPKYTMPDSMQAKQKGIGSPHKSMSSQSAKPQPSVPSGATPSQARYAGQSPAGQTRMMAAASPQRFSPGSQAAMADQAKQREIAALSRPAAPVTPSPVPQPGVPRPQTAGTKPAQPVKPVQPVVPAKGMQQAVNTRQPQPVKAGMNRGMAQTNQADAMARMPTQSKAQFLNPTPFKIPGGI